MRKMSKLLCSAAKIIILAIQTLASACFDKGRIGLFKDA